jgi:hypothetical protein
MNFLQRLAKLLFGAPGGTPGDIGLYYYVKSKRSGEVIRLRVNPNNDLSANDSEDGYFVRKLLHGTQGYDPIEVELNYSRDRKLMDHKITGGDMVDKAAYDAWQQAQAAPRQA